MVKSNELRLGNWLGDTGNIPYQIMPNTILGLYQCEIADKKALGVNPIPISEEWLLNFGFLKHYTSFGKSGFNIHLAEQGYFYFIWGHEQVIIKTVHQLQNLYFAITKEEIEIKEHDNILNME
jgi:hypothetical protein